MLRAMSKRAPSFEFRRNKTGLYLRVWTDGWKLVADVFQLWRRTQSEQPARTRARLWVQAVEPSWL